MGFLPSLAGRRSIRHGAFRLYCCVPPRQSQCRLASASTTTSGDDNVVSFKHKLGLGGNNWSRMERDRYNQVIATALNHGITTLEAGQEGGEQLLLNAFLQSPSRPTGSEVLTITMRLGYRTVTPPSSGTEQQQATVIQSHPGDVAVERHPFLGPNRTMAPLDDDDTYFIDDNKNMIQILHNMSGDYLRRELEQSPLVHHYQQQTVDAVQYHVVPLLHNPESQIMALLLQGKNVEDISVDERQEFLRDRLIQAFMAMEKAVADKLISRYGIVSNGLVLPPEHPLHLATDTILEANRWVMEHLQEEPWYTRLQRPHARSNMAVLQLPINLIEQTGLDIARDLHTIVHDKESNENKPFLNKELEIYAMRPLTCYPDRGTGTGHAFRLVDYLLPSGPHVVDPKNKEQPSSSNADEKGSTSDNAKAPAAEWSNEMDGPPLIYPVALKTAMAHFDAEELLQEKMKRDLTAAERETLDGCKLLQSLLHDMDADLPRLRSLGAYEQDLSQKIIPLIRDTFEEYDEATADVLQKFFTAYSLAVRYAIATNTRRLLKEGGDDKKGYKYKDMPDNAKLQDYALQYLFKEEAISKVIVGASKPDHVHRLVTAACNVKVEEVNAGKNSSAGSKSEKTDDEPTKEG